jgi:hypothetical protein
MIIHSPVISGSLIFAEGATFTLPDGGVYSGSFSGSFQGDGSSLTFSGTNIISSSNQLAADFLDTLGDGVISGSSQIEFNDVNNTPFSQSASSVTVSKSIIPDTNVTYDLGSETNRFKDLYLSNNSIFFEMGTIGVNTGSGFFEIKDANDDPAIIKTERFVLSPSGSSTQTFISAGEQGGVKFLSISDTQMVTYSIDNYDLQNSVTFSYIDSSGNPQTTIISANTSNNELDAQEGSVTRTSGTDKFRIKLLRVPNSTPSAPIEVASLILSGSDGTSPITPGESGSVILPKLILSGSDGTSPITPGESGSVIVPQITVSGSNGTSTITNDLPGDGPAVVDENGEVTPIKVKQVNIVDSVTGDVVQLSVLSGSLITTATDSTGSAITNPKSNLSGSFTGSLTLTSDITTDSGDCVKIGTVANPICEIHGTDIFGAINATNGVVSGSSQIDVEQTTNFSAFSSSIASTFDGLSSNFADLIGIPSGIVSGSTQILTLVSIDEDNMATNSDTKLPTQQSVKAYVDTQVAGLVDSAPGALDTLNELAAALGDDANFSTTLSNTIAGKVSQSLEVISGDGLTGGGNLTTNRTIAVDGTVLRTTGFGVVSGSSQVNADSITNFDSNVKTKLNADGVISGSSQVSLSTTDVSEGTNLYYTDARVKTKLNTETVISGSSQVDVTATTGYSTISSHILNTSNPHSVTAAQVGLGNVTNESKTTMFSSPTFTGTVSGVTKAHVGLGNVDNESKATMFTNAALTGNPTAPTQTGTDDSTKIATTAFVQGRIDAVIGNAGAALDTLGELSASLAQDSGSLASLVTTVGGKLQKDQNLLDLTDVAQARTNLGVDAAGTDNSTDVTLAGSYDYLTISGQVITRNQIDASTDISNLNTTNVSEGSNLYYTDARVKTKLTAEGVISSSAQITITESQISDLDHYTDSDFDARLATKSTTNLSEGTNLYYTDTRVKTKLTAEDVVSGSATQVRSFLNVENGATADQTGAEIKSLYEGEANTNAFTDTLLSKLNGIEAGATADQSAEEIQDIVGAMLTGNTETGITVTYQDTDGTIDFVVATQSDENFTFALLSKLNGIEALADVTDATNVDAAGAVMNSDTSTAAMSFVIDEDTMASNLATKVPTQQSVKTYVDGKVAGLVDSAPGALDTLNELAAALGDDANFSTTVTNSLAGKAANTITISAGNGLSGGGNLTANRTLSMSGTYTGDFAVTGNITATADIVAYASSDERLKKNIELISDPIGKIKQLKGVTWVWKDEASDVAKQSPNVGVIAQDVEKVLPQVVKDRENGYKGVDYGKMVGLLIEAIKDQQKQIDELRSRLK